MLVTLRFVQTWTCFASLQGQHPGMLLLYAVQGMLVVYKVYETPQPLFNTFVLTSFFLDAGIAYFFCSAPAKDTRWLAMMTLATIALIMSGMYGLLLANDIQKDPLTGAIICGILYAFSWQAHTDSVALASSFILLSFLATITALAVSTKDHDLFSVTRALATLSAYIGVVLLFDSANLPTLLSGSAVALLRVGKDRNDESLIFYSSALAMISAGLLAVDCIINIFAANGQAWTSIAFSSCCLLIFVIMNHYHHHENK